MNKEKLGAKRTFLNDESKLFIDSVFRKYEIDKEVLMSTRNRPMIQIKQLIFYFLNEKYKCSFVSIGRFFNNHHATVIHSVKQAKLIKEMEVDRFHFLYLEINKIYENKTMPNYLDMKFHFDMLRISA